MEGQLKSIRHRLFKIAEARGFDQESLRAYIGVRDLVLKVEQEQRDEQELKRILDEQEASK